MSRNRFVGGAKDENFENILIFSDKIIVEKQKLLDKKEKSKNSKNKNPKDRKREGPSRHVIYCIVNTGFFMNKGSLAASVARGVLELYNKADADRVKSRSLEHWENSGQTIIILKGINHKHLVYLAEDLYYSAVETYLLYQKWSKSRIGLVLSVLGREEDLDESLEGLQILK